MFCEQQADGLKWCGGTDIEDKPGRYVPESWMKKAKSVISLEETELLIHVKLNEVYYYRVQKFNSPECNSLRFIDKKIGLGVEKCNKEGENDVNGKEAIDNVVKDEECILLVRQKCKLERANPGRVND